MEWPNSYAIDIGRQFDKGRHEIMANGVETFSNSSPGIIFGRKRSTESFCCFIHIELHAFIDFLATTILQYIAKYIIWM